MKLNYGTQLSPAPIELSIGTLIKPTLQKISELTFEVFYEYEGLIKMTPEFFYTKVKDKDGVSYWDSLSDEEKNEISLYSIVVNNQRLTNKFVDIFNFFFEESVVFKDGYFILLCNSENLDVENMLIKHNVRGVISKDLFPQVLDVIQQVCCIEDENEEEKNIKFSGKLAEEMYKKMQKAKKAQMKKKKGSVDFSLPNIISAVSNRHPTINPINVWQLTVFQLMDAFNRMQTNSIFDIDCTRVSVWGDKEKTFDAALWHKNKYDKKND